MSTCTCIVTSGTQFFWKKSTCVTDEIGSVKIYVYYVYLILKLGTKIFYTTTIRSNDDANTAKVYNKVGTGISTTASLAHLGVGKN